MPILRKLWLTKRVTSKALLRLRLAAPKELPQLAAKLDRLRVLDQLASKQAAVHLARLALLVRPPARLAAVSPVNQTLTLATPVLLVLAALWLHQKQQRPKLRQRQERVVAARLAQHRAPDRLEQAPAGQPADRRALRVGRSPALPLVVDQPRRVAALMAVIPVAVMRLLVGILAIQQRLTGKLLPTWPALTLSTRL